MGSDRYLTVEQFAGLLERIVCGARDGAVAAVRDASQQPEELIKRRTAAGIIHQVLLCAGEADEEQIGAALRLRDLYVCRTCVNHIAQVYAKGIIAEWGDGFFGVDELITYKEAEEMLHRIMDRQLRRKPELSASAGWTLIMWREAELMLKADRRILLVDVRSEEEYSQGHRKGSINVPLQTLFRNPYCACADRETTVFLYCQRGYKSRIAAGLLAEAGYQNVYVIL